MLLGRCGVEGQPRRARRGFGQLFAVARPRRYVRGGCRQLFAAYWGV